MIGIRLLTMFILIVAVIVLIGLAQAKGGILREILIGYFSVEIFMFSIFLSYEIKVDFTGLLKDVAYAILIPKVIVKALFWLYVSKKSKGDPLVK